MSSSPAWSAQLTALWLPLKEEVEKKWEKELNAWAPATGEARRNPSCARAGQQNEAELCIVDVIQKREPHGGV